MNILRAFSHRPFALLWTGQTTSRLGDNLYRIALAWWVLEKTGSATAMGTVLIFSQVPLLIFILIGGIVVDRFPRIRIMFLSDILSGTVVILIALFSWLDVLQIWHIYIASLLFGFVEAFFFPAYQAVIPQIVPPDMLTSANSLNGLSQRIMGVIGPIVGASLVAVGGTSLTFGLDALSFFASAFCVFPILRAGLYEMPKKEDSAATEIKPRRTIKEEIKRGIADLREGWNAIITIPWIWITILIFGVLNIMEGSPRAVAMPFLIKDELGADVAVLGWFGSAFSVGYVVCALWLGQYKRLRRRGLLGYLPIMVNGIMLLLFGLKSPIPVLIAAMFVYGFCFNIFGLVWNSTLQEMVPHEKLGRVYAIDSLGSWILLPIGFALAGWGTDKLGSPTVFLIGGVGTILMILIGLSHPAIRNLD
ncbi:MFS transporter [Candidatus Villigracilis affinis]|uniref:MFS transporter n=1 Tax=Candidatus Villigracilis affinis TaxID=3140682 RepID=UPI001E1459DE|nr:MFS transporter [Anaerolineales bacterium]MBL0346448.1 MFS transporter [Anaerolineales bacterium]